MNVYNIADLVVGLDCQKRTMQRAEKYLIKGAFSKPVITIKTTSELINSINKPGWCEDDKAYVYEGMMFYRQLIQKFNGMMIHASAIVVDDKAYLFSAPSGTGKSTHTSFWLERFGNRAYILNDDKPAVRVFDDGVYAYGTPWSGKNDVSVNKKIRLQAICFIQRDTENWIKRMPAQDIAVNMYRSSIRKIDHDLAVKLFDIISQIANTIPIYSMGCTPTIESAEMSYEVMSAGL